MRWTGELLRRARTSPRRRRSSRATRGRSRRSSRSRTSRRTRTAGCRPRRWSRSRELTGTTAADVLGTCSFYTMLKRRPCGKLVVSVCTNVTCLVTGGPEVLDHLEERYASEPDVTVEEVECLAACGGAPALQVNYEFHERVLAERRPRRSSRATSRARAGRARFREPPLPDVGVSGVTRDPDRHEAAARPSRRLVDDRRRGRVGRVRVAARGARQGRRRPTCRSR